MTLLAELIDIPEQVHKSDFVISLRTAIDEPERTLADYVVTEQLAHSFDRALSLITSAVRDHRSKSAYLHASFGGGKSAFMAVTHLLLRGEPAARAKAELAPLVAKYAPSLDGHRFLLVPYQAVGATSLEQIVLGGYVDHVRHLHPGSPLPAVYVADGILADAALKRAELGDDVFLRILSEGEADDDAWGDYGGAWSAERFEQALAAPPGSAEHDLLLGALLRSHYRAVPGQAQATAEGFIPLDAGLEAISRHAHGLGYDAVVLFLDELVLWLASRMSDHAFVGREGAKVVKLVEGDAGNRPAPIVSLIARQRDLRELVGEHVLGATAVSVVDILRHSEGRFDTITLEDRNLPAIAERRLLRPRSEQARHVLDDAFERVRRQLDERGERDVLLTDTGDLTAFRRLYPFSPALVDALVALSGAMQRERTALKVMLQLLVDGRATLEVGQLIPLGDLFDAINQGDEPLTEIMRAQFAQARRLWVQRFEPMLAQAHGLDEAQARAQPRSSAYVADGRIVKSLLVAALVPEVAPLRTLTVSRLTALNSGVVRAFVPGTERQQVLDKLRRWSAEVGELHLGDDERDPTVWVTLAGIDTAPILDAAKVADTDGDRRRKVRDALCDALGVADRTTFDPYVEVPWRGTRRRVSVVFANVRDADALPDEALRAGADPKVVIDFPWDPGRETPADDGARVEQFVAGRAPEWTAVWLPNFLSEGSRTLLGRLVRHEYVLTGDTFDRLASHLSPTDRPLARSQLDNTLAATRQQLTAALDQAYGVDLPQAGVVDTHYALHEQFRSLDPGLVLRPPVGTSLRRAFEAIADQLLSYRYPKHPDFTEYVSRADLTHTLAVATEALQRPNGRLENVEASLRKALTKVAGPLRVGTMHAAHFVADVQAWVDLVERRRHEAGATTVTVGQARRWLDGADAPGERRGLTADVADLLVLLVATATNRSVFDQGRAITRPEVGKLRDDWELHPQDLPTEAVWDEALRRAHDLGIVELTALRTAVAVADLGQKVHDTVTNAGAQAVRDLVVRLDAAYARLGVDAASPRLRTARAAAALVDALAARPDHPVDVLAAAEVPTTMAALGTSMAQAARVGAECEGMNWELVAAAGRLDDERAGDGAALVALLRDALGADELTTALPPRLRSAERDATRLVTQQPTQVDTPVVRPPDPCTREEAEAALIALRERLRAEAHLDLTWEIRELADGAG